MTTVWRVHRTARKAVVTVDRKLGSVVRPIVSVGSSRLCPLCGWTGWRFLPAGEPPSRRANARCPGCGSKERHRFAHMLLNELGSGHSTLHVAPERQSAHMLEAISSNYVSIDLRPGLAMRQEDLTNLSFADHSFSLIYCSHVLEHIPEDHAAIAEMRRVLRPGGVLLVLVPVGGQLTDEEALEDPEERFERYGLEDHVRLYGLDIIDRLQGSFSVAHYVSTAMIDVDRKRFGLETEEHAFVCRAQPELI